MKELTFEARVSAIVSNCLAPYEARLDILDIYDLLGLHSADEKEEHQ